MKRTIISLLCLAALLCAAIYFYYRNPAAELPPEDGGGPALAKPVIYLYPEEETEVTVCLDLDGNLTCTYPAYDGGWTVTAQPGGILTDAEGRTYNYLYWEGVTSTEYDFSQGFCVRRRYRRLFGRRLGPPGSDPPGGQRVHRLLAPPDGAASL